jgi:NhaP-type Na+/H+ or K+/H+ antiporter
MTGDMLILIGAGALVTVLTGLLSGAMRRFWVTTPILALVIGVLVGPACFGLLDERQTGDAGFVREIAELTLCVSVVAAAAGLPGGFFRRCGPAVLVLLTLTMTLMWLVSATIAWLVLGLAPLAALLLGAIITPTDPVIATTVFTGPVATAHVPRDLRRTLFAESGANDGLAVLFVLLPLSLLVRTDGALGHWLVEGVLIEVLGSIVFGIALGAGAGGLQIRALRADETDTESAIPVLLGLTLVVFVAGRLLGLNPVLASFCAGAAFDAIDHEHTEREQERVQTAVEQILQPPGFIVLGAALPLAAWRDSGWALLGFVVLVLILRRLPAVFATRRWIAPVRTTRDAVFAGWFGPIGIAAVYYAADTKIEHPELAWVWPVVTACAAGSVLVHGVSAVPLTRLLLPAIAEDDGQDPDDEP